MSKSRLIVQLLNREKNSSEIYKDRRRKPYSKSEYI